MPKWMKVTLQNMFLGVYFFQDDTHWDLSLVTYMI